MIRPTTALRFVLVSGALAGALPIPQRVNADYPEAANGVIRGVVVNGSSQPPRPMATRVVLRARVEGPLASIAETQSDASGRFEFRDLPADAEIQYLPGANLGDAHFPGSRIRLDPQQPEADVELVAYESMSSPSPLVIREHNIEMRWRDGGVEVVESLLIENPSKYCYVGHAETGPARALTMTLSIPPNFEKVVFGSEFHGRNFSLLDGRLCTNIPWPPGQRRLAFTYSLPGVRSSFQWKRPIDLPSSSINLTVQTESPEAVRCNLENKQRVKNGTVVYDNAAKPLAKNAIVKLEIGRLPTSLAGQGRWFAVILLACLMAGTSAALYLRPKSPRRNLIDR